MQIRGRHDRVVDLGFAHRAKLHEAIVLSSDAERDGLVHAHELLVGGCLAAAGARDERRFVRWPALHRSLLHRTRRSRSRASILRGVQGTGWQTLSLDEIEPILAECVHWQPLRL